MKRILLVILMVLFSMLNFAATYYVATNGNDSNAGTLASPWATWQKGFNSIHAGDILYIRGGNYSTSGTLYNGAYFGVRASGSDGNATDTIKVYAYQNEKPILDCAAMATQPGIHFGILLNGLDYWHIKGLTVKNAIEYNNAGVYSIANGWNISDCTHVVLDQCSVTYCGDGFTINGITDYLYFINCDSYKNFDRQNNGGYADGFQSNNNPGTHIFYIGCRAWQNSDDGYDEFGGDGYIVVDHCWAFRNGNFITIGNGMGFKFGAVGGLKESGVQRIITNNIAFDQANGHGFDESADISATMDFQVYNNTAFRNGVHGFSFYQPSGSGIVSMSNNISYNNRYTYNLRTSVMQTTNSWQNGISLSDADFLSIDTTGVSGPRQADGSLPNINFLKLKSPSKLIDAGTKIGISFNGSAPDLGAFESIIASSDNIAPIVSSFTVPATSSSPTVSILTLIASDNIGVTGYLLTESSVIPSVGASGWSLAKPSTYTFSSTGSKTLYAWAKDAAGNISASLRSSVTISSPTASTYTVTGPSSGNVNSSSASFTITPNNPYTGTITITPSGTGSAGLSTNVLTFSNSSTAQTFTITPTVAGSITLTPTNSGTLTNPTNITYTVNAVVPNTPTSVAATAGNASASITFVTPTNNGGSVITGYTVTSIPSGGIDTNAGSTSLNHTITGLTNGTSYTFSVKAINSVGTSVASVASNSVIPKAPAATTFTFTGPSNGKVNNASASFTVTPNNLYTGTITITPTGTGSAGLSPKVLTFSSSSAAQTFTITPTVAGSITLMATNNGTLSNPANLVYTSNAVVPNAPTSVVATSGEASASVTFTAPTNTGGSVITGYTVTSDPAGGVDANAGSTALTHTITGLTNGNYTFTVKATNSVGSSVASVASNPIESVIIKQGEIIPSHFTTVWQGLNGLNHMNINVVSAILDGLSLSADDEIAVFSGSACVGASKLTKSIIPSDNSTFLTILASQNDGSGNGFIDNDTIVFKIWNNKTQNEIQVNAVVYRNDVSTWKTNGRYSPGATTVVEIACYKVYTQSIELLKGYNMISTYVSVQSPNVSTVTKSLQDQGNLIKMQDETGNSFENWGTFGGWINQLGSLEETEGYKIQVANNCTLQVAGRSITMPFDISLKTGWNIISYPRTDVVNAMNVVQALIDQNKLVKVQDEAGNSIENWGLFGGWKNGIGNFIPGKAYKVKMSADAILTFQEGYPKSAVVLAKSEQTEYYHSSVEGNGTDHMNINITGLNNIGLSVGDELAAFDGAVCVASTKITEANLLSGSASLASSYSTSDKNSDGFKVGDPIQISTWSKLSGNESKVNAEVITGQLKYEKNASVLVKMKSASIATGITNLGDAVKIDVFPNPSQGLVTVRFSEIPEANSRIEISDVSGRKLISRFVTGTSEVFNLDSFTSGLYLVKSILGSKEFVQKLIVNK